MKTFAEIQDGVIVNTSAWETETPQGDQFVDITEVPNAGVGWLYVNGEFIDPTPAPTTAPSSGDIPVTEV